MLKISFFVFLSFLVQYKIFIHYTTDYNENDHIKLYYAKKMNKKNVFGEITKNKSKPALEPIVGLPFRL